MSLASNLLPTIVKTVRQYGNTLTLLKEGTAQRVDGDLVYTDDVEIQFKAGTEFITPKNVQGTIEVGDLSIIAVFDDIVPIVENKIIFQNETYSIINEPIPLVFQDVIMAYQIYARK